MAFKVPFINYALHYQNMRNEVLELLDDVLFERGVETKNAGGKRAVGAQAFVANSAHVYATIECSDLYVG